MRIKRAFSYRSMFSFTAAFLFISVFFSALSFSPSIQTAGACPVEIPIPLRELYTMSERVVVATVTGSTVNKVENETEDGKSVMMKIALNVSDTLKGEDSQPLIHIYHWMYIPKQEPQEESEADSDDNDSSDKFEKGKKLLLFLLKAEDDDKDKKSTIYQVVDSRYGVKDLSGGDLSVYVKRINELSTILNNKQPDKKEIVEWLVRCAEEPATRWEGAFDLNRNFDAMLYENEEEGEDTESTADDESEEATTAESDEQNDSTVESGFSELITESHKQRLSNALYQIKTLSDNDYQLISLVKRWEGKRVAAFLLPQLRNLLIEDASKASYLMNDIAELVEDKELTKLANMFSEIYYLDKDDEVDLSELESSIQENTSEDIAEEAEETVEANGKSEPVTVENKENTSDKETANVEKKEKEIKPKAGQVRNDVLERFITLCESLLAKQ